MLWQQSEKRASSTTFTSKHTNLNLQRVFILNMHEFIFVFQLFFCMKMSANHYLTFSGFLMAILLLILYNSVSYNSDDITVLLICFGICLKSHNSSKTFHSCFFIFLFFLLTFIHRWFSEKQPLFFRNALITFIQLYYIHTWKLPRTTTVLGALLNGTSMVMQEGQVLLIHHPNLF